MKPSELQEGEWIRLRQPWSPMILCIERENGELAAFMIDSQKPTDTQATEAYNLYGLDEASIDKLAEAVKRNGAEEE